MGTIVVSENVTLDVVIEDPAGVEGFRLGGCVGRVGGGYVHARPLVRERSAHRDLTVRLLVSKLSRRVAAFVQVGS